MPFPVPNGEASFFDINGNPLTGGQVFFYIPGTSSPTNTYADSGMTVANPNPLTLDQAGRCVAWIDGFVRQVVHDMFGNLIWDQTTGIQIDHIFGNLQVDGALNVNGAASFQSDIAVNGLASVSGSLNVGGDSNFAGALTVGGIVDSSGGFVTTGSIDVNGGDIHVNGGELWVDTIRTQNNNPAQIEFLNSFTVNQTPGLDFAINVLNGQSGQRLRIDGNIIHITSAFGETPCFALGDITANTNYGMWGGTDLAWGITDGAGVPQTPLMYIDANGNLTVAGTITSAAGGSGPTTFTDTVFFTHSGNSAVFSGDIAPATARGSNCGNSGGPWASVWAGSYITASTDATSPLMMDGALDLVASTPVKTEPHVGISAEDAARMEGVVVEEAGTDTNALVGYLWKAVQELKSGFDAYVAAHP